METKNSEATKNKVVVPYLIAGILLAIAWVLYLYYFSTILPDMYRYKLLDWTFSLTALDFFAVLAVAVITILIAFNKAKIKHLAIPIFVNVAMMVYTVFNTAMMYGFRAFDTFFIFSNVMMILSYVLLGVYTLKKSSVILFATITTTFISAINMYFNVEKIIYSVKVSAGLDTMLATLFLAFQTIGILILVWTCCALHTEEKENKDIFKKNIILSVILSIITLGIYVIFWVKTMSNDIATLEGSKVNSCLETAMFFSVPFYAVYWLYKNGKKTAKLSKDADMSVLLAVQGLFMLCFFSLALMQSQLHLAIGLYEQSKTAKA